MTHKNTNDYISFLVCLKADVKEGYFVFTSTNLRIHLQPGDGIMMDTDVIAHGNLGFHPTKIERKDQPSPNVLVEAFFSDGFRMVAVSVFAINNNHDET